MIFKPLFSALLVLLVSLWALPVNAAWSHDPTENNPFCTEPGNIDRLQSIADGSGGTFIVWTEDRSGNLDIYAQRLDAAGTPLWAEGGAGVCTAAGDQLKPAVASDGAGGLLVSWSDSRYAGGSDVYAQRLDSGGLAQWAHDGVVISAEFLSQSTPRMVSDGAGGAIITWTDYRFHPTNCTDVYAQRVSGAGVTHWTVDGVAVCSDPGCQSSCEMVTDGAGGAFLVWQDERDGNFDLYAQHLDGAGVAQWSAGGIAVCVEPSDQDVHRLIPDGAGGVIIGWADDRASDLDIYAQRLSSIGALQWAVEGMPVSTAFHHQSGMQMVSDGAGGAIFGWSDLRFYNYDIYAQRIDANGAQSWIPDGVAICVQPEFRNLYDVVPDGAGGAVFAWQDSRDGTEDIYSQRLDGSGTALWTADGVAVCTAANDQGDPVMVSDGAGGATIAWEDQRAGGGAEGYAQWVDANGNIGGPAANNPPVAEAGANPPAGYPALEVRFQNSSWDADDDELEYLWDFDDPGSPYNSSTLMNPRHSYENQGHYAVILTVSDGIDEDTVTVYVTVWEPTISAAYGCVPASGTVPFSTRFRATMYNERDDQYRRVAGRVNIQMAGGSSVMNWRSGSTTLSPGESYNAVWFTTFPAVGSIIGQNRFTLELEDVTVAPYNQPPYAPSGDRDTSVTTVTAFAP